MTSNADRQLGVELDRWIDKSIMIAPGHRKSTLCGVSLIMIGSCVTADPTPVRFAVRHVADGNTDALFAAAEAVVTDLGYEIARRDVAGGLLVSQAPYRGSADPTHRTSRLSSRARVRRLAEIRIKETPEAVKVFCKVAIQEQTTRAHRMFAVTQAGDDRPGDTAIDRDAATTIEQNTVWRTVRRDKSAERAILEALVNRGTRGRPSEADGD